jgi:hypothetical protein
MDNRQEELEQQEAEIRQALNRVRLGLGGTAESTILAAALGPRFRDDNDLCKGDA